MDPKYVRTTVENLLADLLRNPGIGRPRSFMGRYGRPLGLGIVLGIGGAMGCSGSGDGADALPAAMDVYGAADFRPPPRDTRDDGADVPTTADTRDALPPSPDLYGIFTSEVPLARDTRDALPPSIDGHDVADVSPADTRDALPPAVDIYAALDRPLPVDTKDAGPSVDLDAIDGGAVDGNHTG